jgi:hypothetical protein
LKKVYIPAQGNIFMNKLIFLLAIIGILLFSGCTSNKVLMLGSDINATCDVNFVLQSIDGNTFLCVPAGTGVDLSAYLKGADANGFYTFKTDTNIWINQSLVPYLLKADANVFYAKIGDVNIWINQKIAGLSSTDTNNQTAGWQSADGNWLIDINTGNYNIDTNQVFANVIWTDKNRMYGIYYCVNGDIVVGWLGGGFSC